MKSSYIGLFFIILITNSIDPVIVFHGLGDQCSNAGMDKFTQMLGTQLNTYSVCIQIGNGAMSSVFKPFDAQAKQACSKIQADPKLSGDVSVVGLSQGALIARSIIESCQFNGNVKRFISIGGPQMGVSKFPGCFTGMFCKFLNLIVDEQVYSGVIQNHVGPAGYFHDFKHQNKFISKSHFITKLNNQVSFDQSQSKKLASVNMMLVMFDQDSVVYPKESEWFEYFDTKGNLVDFFNTDVYLNNYLPLKEMNENKQISFIRLPGDHLRFTNEDVTSKFVPFLKDEFFIQSRIQI